MDGDSSFYTYDIELKIVGLLQQTNDFLFFGREFWEELALDSIGKSLPANSIILPSRSFYQILSTTYQPCPIVANQIVAALGERLTDVSWECKHSAIVALGYLCCNQAGLCRHWSAS